MEPDPRRSATILLAIEQPELRAACAETLARRGYDVLLVDSALARIQFQRFLECDLLCVDDSNLARDCLVITHPSLRLPVLGVGLRSRDVEYSLPLPMRLDAFAKAVDAILAGERCRAVRELTGAKPELGEGAGNGHAPARPPA